MRIILYDQIQKRKDLLVVELKSLGISSEISPLEGIAASTSGMDENACNMLPVLIGLSPDFDAAELIREFRASGSTSPVIILQAALAPVRVAEILDAGADDVITSTRTGAISTIEIAARLRAVTRRNNGASEPKVTLGSLVVYLDGRHPEVDGVPVKISARENTILSILAFNAGKVVRREAIFDTLYTLSDYQPYMKAIDIHICKLRKKLAPYFPDGHVPIRTYNGKGYCLDMPDVK